MQINPSKVFISRRFIWIMHNLVPINGCFVICIVGIGSIIKRLVFHVANIESHTVPLQHGWYGTLCGGIIMHIGLIFLVQYMSHMSNNKLHISFFECLVELGKGRGTKLSIQYCHSFIFYCVKFLQHLSPLRIIVINLRRDDIWMIGFFWQW